MSAYMKYKIHLNVWIVIWCITWSLPFKYTSKANMARAIYAVIVQDTLIPWSKGEGMRNAVHSRNFIWLDHGYVKF